MLDWNEASQSALVWVDQNMQSPITDGGSAFFPLPGKDRTPEAIAAERKEILTRYGIMMGLEVFLYTWSFVMTPGYITPMFNYPIPRLVFLLLTFWQISAIAGHWYLAPLNKTNKGLLMILCIFMLVPGILFPMLGPATIAIMNSLGPIFGGQ